MIKEQDRLYALEGEFREEIYDLKARNQKLEDHLLKTRLEFSMYKNQQ